MVIFNTLPLWNDIIDIIDIQWHDATYTSCVTPSRFCAPAQHAIYLVFCWAPPGMELIMQAECSKKNDFTAFKQQKPCFSVRNLGNKKYGTYSLGTMIPVFCDSNMPHWEHHLPSTPL